ncbi:MAG: hypothetical protein GVY29_13705, partial [Spirochaetes bacterium]|nr:hypothetical protein [Spirochaetota bacterium]
VRSYLAFSHRFVAPLLSEEDLRRYYRRKYEWSVALYREFEEVKHELPRNQILTLPFNEISEQLPAAMERFFRFAELAPDEQVWRSFRERRRRRHHKGHVNQALPEFGIDPDELRHDLSFVWERYLLDDSDNESPEREVARG